MLLGPPGDNLLFLQNLWRTRKALVEEERLPFFTDLNFLPFRLSFLHTTHTFFYGSVYAAGSFLLKNPVFWMNLCILLSFVLTGYGTFLLAHRLTGHWPASLVAATAFAFCGARAFRAAAHLNILSNEFIPFCLLFLFRGLAQKRPGQLGAAALFLAAAAWNCYYNTLFILLFTIFYLAANPWTKCFSPRPWRKTLAAGAAAAAVFLLLVSPMIGGILATVREADMAPPAPDPSFSASPLCYLIPSGGHSLLGRYWAPLRKAALGEKDGIHLFLGYAALLLAAYGIARTKLKCPWQRFFLLSAAAFFVLSLGPHYRLPLPFARETRISLPFGLLTSLPFLEDFRVPERLGLMTIFCVALLSAYGFKALWERWGASRRSRAALLAAVLGFILFEHAEFPLSHFDVFDPKAVPFALTQRIAQDPDPGTVLQFPLYPCDYRGSWLQVFHDKPILAGLHSRIGESRSMYYLFLNVGGWFCPVPTPAERLADPLPHPNGELYGAVAQAELESAPLWTKDSVAQFCFFFNIRYILLPQYAPGIGLGKRLRTQLFEFSEILHQDDSWLGLLKKPASPFPLRIDAASPVHSCFFLRNFSSPRPEGRWLVGRSSTMAFRLEEPQPLRLALRLRYAPPDPEAGQGLAVRLNGATIWQDKIQTGESTEEFEAPESAVRKGYNYLDLAPEIPANFEGLALAAPKTPQSIVLKWVEISTPARPSMEPGPPPANRN